MFKREENIQQVCDPTKPVLNIYLAALGLTFHVEI